MDTKHPGGRPEEYKPEYVQKVKDYLQTCGREQTRLPKLVDIELLLDCDNETIKAWAEKYPEFSAAIKKVTQSQLAELQDDGLFGGKEINANVAIFLMKANHGMIETEKRQIDVTTDGKPLEINITEDKLNNDDAK